MGRKKLNRRRSTTNAALESMEEIDREVLTLRHFEELTNNEVAEGLEISKAGYETKSVAVTVKSGETVTVAVSLGKEVDVVIDTRTPAYTLNGVQEQTLSSAIDLSIREHHSMLPAKAVRADDEPGGERILRFYPDGSTSGAVITMHLGGAAYLIEMDWLIGAVSVSRGTIDDY